VASIDDWRGDLRKPFEHPDIGGSAPLQLYALAFPGTASGTPTGYALTGSTAIANVEQRNFTVSLWFRQPNVSGNRCMFGISDSSGLFNTRVNIFFVGADLYTRIYTGAGGQNVIVPYSTLNTWTHLAYVVDNSLQCTQYINGVSVGTLAGTGTTSGVTSGQVIIGGMSATNNVGGFSAWNGSLDDVRIYRPALAAGDVATLAAKGNPAVAPTNRWMFEENAGNSLADLVGGVTATKDNTVTWTTGVSGLVV